MEVVTLTLNLRSALAIPNRPNATATAVARKVGWFEVRILFMARSPGCMRTMATKCEDAMKVNPLH